MINFDLWKLPDGERHLQDWMIKTNRRLKGRLTYQISKYEKALEFVPVTRRRVAVDVGAHAGLWSYWMAKHFETLHAFEPKPSHQECWFANMLEYTNSTLHPVGLGAADGRARLVTEPASSGDSHAVLVADGPVEIRTLDSYGLSGVDFMKIDVEGFEYPVCQGARETLLANKPIVIIEQKNHEAKYYGAPPHQALGYLTALGMSPMCKPMIGDFIMGWA